MTSNAGRFIAAAAVALLSCSGSAGAQVMPGQALPNGFSFAPPAATASAPAAQQTPLPQDNVAKIYAMAERARQQQQQAAPQPTAAPAPASFGFSAAARTPTAAVGVPVGTVLRGEGTAVDGGTLRVGGRTVHLTGLIPADLQRICPLGPVSWACGEAGKRALDRILARHGRVACVVGGNLADGSVSGRCRVGRDDLGEAVVQTGMAKSAEPSYAGAAALAQGDRRGLWIGHTGEPVRPGR